MRYTLALILVGTFSVVCAQQRADFEVLVQVPTTGLKDQQSSGTCWSFATVSFIETEALRLGKDSVSLSAIYYVKPIYLAKAEKFIATKGDTWFAPGDLTFSVLEGYKKYGAVPELVYDGRIDEDWQHDHLEMDNLLLAMVESVGTSGYGRIKPNSWRQAMEGVLDAYLGIAPATFLYEGELYTPQSFAKQHVGINPDDYIEVTSYTHENFYTFFELAIPANWSGGKYLNLPLADFEMLIDHALENGFSLAWDGDASEPNFDFDAGILELPASSESSTVSQAMRQETFENGSTADDHNMHIIGKAKSHNGTTYYLMKNSEGTNEMGGYIYMSRKALLLKTISVLVHKDALPADIRAKSSLN